MIPKGIMVKFQHNYLFNQTKIFLVKIMFNEFISDI